ncbi:hypothetical protein [Peribacillus loiseleuriae]|uniref:hypothetical protein n=1 Tax=Peribacillus loiseleuriae TaxID=1679170 RepID=UPI0015D5726A|nr:hypothetical protein [Peribacillus loiseleuriae]
MEKEGAEVESVVSFGYIVMICRTIAFVPLVPFTHNCRWKERLYMIRKCLLFLMLFTFLPGSVMANSQSGQYYPPTNSDYFQKKFSWQIYVSHGVKKITFIQYDMENKERGLIYYDDPPQNSFFWVDFTCRGNVRINFYNKKGKLIGSFTRGHGTSYLNNSACNYKDFVYGSDFDEKNRKYKSDKFKGPK